MNHEMMAVCLKMAQNCLKIRRNYFKMRKISLKMGQKYPRVMAILSQNGAKLCQGDAHSLSK
jgi:hypothetical protein